MSTREIVNPKPTYEVSVGAGFFCIINSKTSNSIEYQDTVTRLDVIRTLGITPAVTEQEIWASGILFDFISQTSGANIALTAVALPADLLTELSGADKQDGFVFNKVNDLEKEFAFGYWGENRNGTLVFYWHPVCKLALGEDTKTTRNNDPPDPQKNYNIKVIPFGSGDEGGVWRVKYDQQEAKAIGKVPLTVDEFFINPIYRKDQIPTQLISQAAAIAPAFAAAPAALDTAATGQADQAALDTAATDQATNKANKQK